MPIGSGSVSATGINLELGRSSNASMSIDTAENGGYGAINQCSPSRPSATNPASYSEWRNYNHSYACCNTPAITAVSGATASSLDIYWVGLSNCTASHIEYSTDQSSWSNTSAGCVSPRTVGGLASGTTYYFRIRITCTSTGGYSGYSNVMSGTTGASYPAYGTYLSQYCSGCTLYYRYADGSGGYYDVSRGCSTSCGGCCCATAAGTFLYEQCSGCDLYYYYADGCYGTTSTLVSSNDPSCGCGGPASWCQFGQTDGSGPYYFTNCQGMLMSGEIYWVEDLMSCIDVFQPYRGVTPLGTDCSYML